jgi:mitotic-spindle organizing protein 1
MSDRSVTHASTLDEAAEGVELLYEMSRIMNTGLDRKTLSILLSLCECGVNPEALAAVVKEIKREANSVTLQAKK